MFISENATQSDFDCRQQGEGSTAQGTTARHEPRVLMAFLRILAPKNRSRRFVLCRLRMPAGTGRPRMGASPLPLRPARANARTGQRSHGRRSCAPLVPVGAVRIRRGRRRCLHARENTPARSREQSARRGWSRGRFDQNRALAEPRAVPLRLGTGDLRMQGVVDDGNAVRGSVLDGATREGGQQGQPDYRHPQTHPHGFFQPPAGMLMISPSGGRLLLLAFLWLLLCLLLLQQLDVALCAGVALRRRLFEPLLRLFRILLHALAVGVQHA